MLWLAVTLAVLFALLAVPVDVAFTARHRGDAAARLETRLTVGWLWGLVRLPTGGGGEASGKNRPERRRKWKKRTRRSGARRALAVMRADGFPRRLLRLARDVLGRIHIRRLDLDLRLGLDDPADTGRLWGLIGPAANLLALPAPARVAVVPEFAGPLLHLNARAEARIVPAALVWVLAAFLLSPPTLRAVGAAVRGAR